MKRLIAILIGAALCVSLCACGTPHEHEFYNLEVLEEPCEGNAGKKTQICLECDETQTVDYPAESFISGDVFFMTIEKFNSRLASIGARFCPGMTVELRADEWSAVTELRYNGQRFCQITYYDHDGYWNSPYPDAPMNADKLGIYGIRYINVLDYPDVPHAPNSFAAIAMTFDPLITMEEAMELGDYLAATRQEEYGNYLVTEINGVGYGHAYPVNQLQYSGSITIHAAGKMPDMDTASSGSCRHDPPYEFNNDGVASGLCNLCGAYVGPEDNAWRYLSSMKVVDHSNSSPNGNDIAIGDWQDPAGAVYWGAMKFWVRNHPGWSNTEYIEYSLDGNYSTLSGTLVSAAESDPDSYMWIEIYLDGQLAHTTSPIGLYDYMTYVLDIQGVKNIGIACVTSSDADGCCVVTAAVY